MSAEGEADFLLEEDDDNSEDSGRKRTLKRLRKGKCSGGDGGVSKTQRPARQTRVVQYVEIQSDEDDGMAVVEKDGAEEGEGAATSASAGGGSRKSSRTRKVSPKVAEAQKAGEDKKGRAAGRFDWGKWSNSSVAHESRDDAQETNGRSKERVGRDRGDRRLVSRPLRRRAARDDADSQDEEDDEEDDEEEISSDDGGRPRRRLRKPGKRSGKDRSGEDQRDERSRRSQRSSASGPVTYNVDDMFKESMEVERQMAKLYDEEDRARARQRRRSEKGLREGEAEDGPGSSEDDSSSQDEGEGMPLPRLLARKALTQAEWRALCDGMNTSEITRGSFWIQEDEDLESPELIEKFLVRWQGFSYLHVSWETEADLTRCVGAPAKAALKRWRVKEGQGLLEVHNVYNPDEHFDPSYLEIDRLLAIDDKPDDPPTEDKAEDGQVTSRTQGPEDGEAQGDEAVAMDVEGDSEDQPQGGTSIAEGEEDKPKHSGQGVRYLVKWCGLPYCESTWERAVDLHDKDLETHIQLYTQRQGFPTMNHSPVLPFDPPASEGKEVTPQVDTTEGGAEEGEDPPHKPTDAAAGKMAQPVFKGGGQLRDYQWEAVLWLVHNWKLKKGSILADEMGLGKTVQTMAYLNTLYTSHKVAGPFLVVAPLSTLQHWYREVCAWTDLNALVYHGSAEDRAVMWEYEFWFPSTGGAQGAKRTQSSRKKLPKFQVLITTPEMCIASDNSMLTDIKWQVLVVDEAHRLKSRTSRLTTTLREQFHFDGTLLLTGTPLQNNTEELWTLLNFANPRAFSDVSDFQRRYGDLKDQEQVSSLHKVLSPYLLRRMKEEVEKGLPPKEETIIEVEMTALQKQYYRALYEKNVGFLHKGDKHRADTSQVMNLHMELRKCCNHPFLLGRTVEDDIRRHTSKEGGAAATEGDKLVECSGKLILLDKLLPKLHQSGHRVLIFSQFKIMLDVLEDYLTSRGLQFGRIDGSITGAKRQASIDEYNREGSPLFIMLLSTRAGGVGINLTTADTVIIFDSDWNPQNDVQAQARCHRIGQDKPVKIYRLLTSKTYEMKMFHSSSLKLGLDQAVLHGFEQQTGASAKASTSTTTTGPPRLSKEELEALLRHGAYDVFKEEREGQSEEHSRRFCEEDIDQILSRSTKIVHGGPTTTTQTTLGSFSKASFAIRNETISIDDPSFWDKVVGVNQRDTELKERSCRGGSKRYKADNSKQWGACDSVAANSSGDSSDSDRDGGANAAIPYAVVNRLFTSLFHHGYGKWDLITQDAKVKEGLQPQVPLLCQHLVAHLVRAAGEQRARDLTAPPEPAAASASRVTADGAEGAEGAGTAKAEVGASKSKAPLPPVDRADVLPQCRSLVEAYAVARVALQNLHKALVVAKAVGDGGESPVPGADSCVVDWEDLGGVGEWLVDVALPSAIPLDYMTKLLPRSGLETKLRNLDDMLVLDKMIQGLESGGDSQYGGFLRIVLDPVRRAVKPPCPWWDPGASKLLVRNARSLLKGLRLGQKELQTLQYTAQPWPNANKVSKYLRDLCEAFRRLDRGQSLSYQHHRPAQQPHTSRPKVSSLSSAPFTEGAGPMGQQVSKAGGGGAVGRGPSASGYFSTGSSGRFTSMLRQMPAAAASSGNTGLKPAIETGKVAGSLPKQQVTQPRQDDPDSSRDDDVVLVLDDEEEEKEKEDAHAAGEPLRPTSPRKRGSPVREPDQEPPAKKAVRSDLLSGVQPTTESSTTGSTQVQSGTEEPPDHGGMKGSEKPVVAKGPSTLLKGSKQVSITKWFSKPVGISSASQQQ